MSAVIVALAPDSARKSALRTRLVTSSQGVEEFDYALSTTANISKKRFDTNTIASNQPLTI